MYTVYSLIISVSLTHESNVPGTGPLGHWGTGSRSNDSQGAPPKWITGPPGQSSGTSSEHQQSATDRRQVFQTWGFPWFDPKTIGETHEITTKITKCQDLGFPMFPYFKNPMASIICRWKLGSRRCCTPAGWHLRLPALHRCKKGARQPVRFPAGDGIWLTVSLHVS